MPKITLTSSGNPLRAENSHIAGDEGFANGEPFGRRFTLQQPGGRVKTQGLIDDCVQYGEVL